MRRHEGTLSSFPATPLSNADTYFDRIADIGIYESVHGVVEDFLFPAILVLLQVVLAVLIAFSLAVFFYFAFVYEYLPALEQRFPVPLDFVPCEEKVERCSFISGLVDFGVATGSRAASLAVGQPYTLVVELDLPESEVNLNMFNVGGEVAFSRSVNNLATRKGRHGLCRPTMLNKRSATATMARTVLSLPYLLWNYHVMEGQTLKVIFDSDFRVPSSSAISGAEVSVLSRHVELYESRLVISTEYVGLKYLVFHYPITTASVGIAINFVILLTLFGFSKLFTNYSLIFYGLEI